MTQPAVTQAEIDALFAEHKAYIDDLKRKWLAQNRMDSKDVYEVMRPQEREEVHRRIAQWGRYITPIAEAWWEERGYGVVWPEDNSETMRVFRLEVAV